MIRFTRMLVLALAALCLFGGAHAHAGLGPGYPPLPEAPAHHAVVLR
jgi:hypothetical protein